MDKTNIDLNAPAFGPGSQKVADISADKPETEPEVKEEVIEKVVETEAPAGDKEEEEPKRVTYSRFKNIWSRAEAAEKAAEEAKHDAEEWKRRAEIYREPVKAGDSTTSPDATWLKLYGNSEDSIEAWKLDQESKARFQDRVIQEAREKALEAVQNERYQEEIRVAENLDKIDSQMEQLEAYTGRELSEKEQSTILDIVDEYTPKNDKGDYLGATIPFEKAWDIYELKQQASKASKTQSRDAVAAINASQSQGEPSTTVEKDKNFNPLDWSAWKRRL